MILKELNRLSGSYSYFPRYSKYIFFLIITICCFVYNYHSILFLPPQSIHQWRQSDCLSIALNYFQDNNHFWEPSVHNLGKDGTGKTASDFPLIYFTVAQLWKIFGHHEFIFRLLNLLIFFSGLFMVFKLVEEELKDSLIAIAIPCFLFASPMLAYYANNFLMDVPAFSLSLIALYYFMKYYKTGLKKYFYLFVALSLIAGLLKISSLIIFIAACFFMLIDFFQNRKIKDDKKAKYSIKHILAPLCVIAIQALWYFFANHYNNKHNSGFFLIGTLPAWKLSVEQISDVFHHLKDNFNWVYFRPSTQIVLLLMFIAILFFYKKTNNVLFILSSTLALGMIAFILLFFEALKDHDYYLINLMILVPVIALSFFHMLKHHYPNIYFSALFRIAVIAFLIHNIDFARRRINDRYSPSGWQNKYYTEQLSSFNEIAPFLRSIGIKQEDRILSLSDNSINITLYAMNQKGWTNYGISADSTLIKEKINMGAKYLVIYNKEDYKNQTISLFLKNKIGTYKNVDIYKL